MLGSGLDEARRGVVTDVLVTNGIYVVCTIGKKNILNEPLNDRLLPFRRVYCLRSSCFRYRKSPSMSSDNNNTQQLGPSGYDNIAVENGDSPKSIEDGNDKSTESGKIKSSARGSKSTAGGNLDARSAEASAVINLERDVRKLEDKLEGMMDVLQWIQSEMSSSRVGAMRPGGVPRRQETGLPPPTVNERVVTNHTRRPFSPMAPRVTFQGVSVHEIDNEQKISMKMIERVQHMKPPGGIVWQGIQDARCGARFLNDVATLAVESNLNDEALVTFFRKKCIQPELDERLSEVCSDLYACRPVPYGEVLQRIKEHFNTIYAYSNSRARILSHIESCEWAKGARSFDHYMALVRSVIKDGVVCGLAIDDDVKVWTMKKGLPDKLREWVDNWIPEDTTMEELERRLVLHLSKSSIPYFKQGKFPGMKQGMSEDQKPFNVGRPSMPVRGAGLNEEEEMEINGVERNRNCKLCGKTDHFVRDCPDLEKAKEKLFGDSEKNRQFPLEAQRQDPEPKLENKKPSLSWDRAAKGVALCGMGNSDTESLTPTMEVMAKSAAAKVAIKVEALIDTGAACSICSREFAEELYHKNALEAEDVVNVRMLKFKFANSDTGSDIGRVHMVINDIPTTVHVLENVSPGLILGNPFITKSEDAKRFLFDYLNCKPVNTVRSSNLHANWPEVSFPWKSDVRPVSNMKDIYGQAKRLERDLMMKGMLPQYVDIIDGWESNGWLIESSMNEVKHFLKHFAVIKGGETEMAKCRLVVDGSSLRDFINPGNCSHRDLLGNLIAWRGAARYNVIDISSAYMRLKISEEDSYYMGIYFRGKAYRFASLPMGVNCSASSLQECVDSFVTAWVRDNESPINDTHVQIIPYMDDLLQLIVPNEFNKDGIIDENDELDARKSLVDFLEGNNLKVSSAKLSGTYTTSKVLGVKVNIDDQLFIEYQSDLGGKVKLTRAEVVSMLSSSFDPLGLDAEMQMWGRQIISETAGYAWKQPVSEDVMKRLNQWVACVKMRKVEVPRYLDVRELFVFVDASIVGVGVVILAKDKQRIWQRLFCKAVLYKKHQKSWTTTSAKIELLALQVGVQCSRHVVNALKRIGITPAISFGTDSEVNVNRLYDPEVARLINDPWQRKVTTIVSNSLKNMNAKVFHVPGPCNPADSVSRGVIVTDTIAIAQTGVTYESRGFVPPGMDCELSCETEVSCAIRINATNKRDTKIVSLNERYLTEREPGQSREAWFHDHQKKRPRYPKRS